ncbi:MAG: hypothetical protein ACYSR9_14835 [Planctomycetota bacterium]|jgi:hypothetical protein
MEGRNAAFNRVNFEQLEAIWDERYQRRFGFWRLYVTDVIRRYLNCGELLSVLRALNAKIEKT